MTKTPKQEHSDETTRKIRELQDQSMTDVDKTTRAYRDKMNSEKPKKA